jgi:hypothetical protein
VLIVYGMLQSKTWGWVLPKVPLTVGNVTIAPLGLSVVPFLIAAGVVLIWLFLRRQRTLMATARPALLDTSMFRIARLRSGLSVLGAQYAVTAGLFFMVPIYLQMTLGLDALTTGIRVFPLSIALILFSIVGTVLTRYWSPRRIVRVGQLVLVLSVLALVPSVSTDLRSVPFGIGMFCAGVALGLLASQLGNVNMSSVTEEKSSEVGGLQGVFQNLGSSLGTALVGSILIAALGTSFVSAVTSSDLPQQVTSTVLQETHDGVAIVPASEIPHIAQNAGLSSAQGDTLQSLYTNAQIDSLQTTLFVLAVIAALGLFFSRHIPNTVIGRPSRKKDAAPAE